MRKLKKETNCIKLAQNLASIKNTKFGDEFTK